MSQNSPNIFTGDLHNYIENIFNSYNKRCNSKTKNSPHGAKKKDVVSEEKRKAKLRQHEQTLRQSFLTHIMPQIAHHSHSGSPLVSASSTRSTCSFSQPSVAPTQSPPPFPAHLSSSFPSNSQPASQPYFQATSANLASLPQLIQNFALQSSQILQAASRPLSTEFPIQTGASSASFAAPLQPTSQPNANHLLRLNFANSAPAPFAANPAHDFSSMLTTFASSSASNSSESYRAEFWGSSSDVFSSDSPQNGPKFGSGSFSVRLKFESEPHEASFPCRWADCCALFSTTSALSTHISEQHIGKSKEKYVCLWQGCKRECRPFPILQQALRHIQTHTGEKPFRCKHPGCGQSFSQANVLATHTRTHTGEKPYQCPLQNCGRRFAHTNCLTAHVRSHTGERPHECCTCGKRFAGLSNLAAHMRVHTGERPYVCSHEGCGKRFSTSGDLTRHCRIHTGQKPYACAVFGCEKRFITAGQLSCHMRMHTGEKPYRCHVESCGKKYSDSTTLRRHLKAHGIDASKGLRTKVSHSEASCSLVGRIASEG